MKKYFLRHWLLLLLVPGYAFSAMEATPFKIPQDKMIITADVINFAYNCVLMEDGSNIYEVIPNSYAKSGKMHVTIRCNQYSSEVTLPLSIENTLVTTTVTTYPVNFSKSAPAVCQQFTELSVVKDSNLLLGYVLKLS